MDKNREKDSQKKDTNIYTSHESGIIIPDSSIEIVRATYVEPIVTPFPTAESGSIYIPFPLPADPIQLSNKSPIPPEQVAATIGDVSIVLPTTETIKKLHIEK